MFLAQTRIRSHFFRRFKKGVSNPLIKTELFAFIICKNHPESRLETLILRQKSDDKRTPSPTYLFILTMCKDKKYTVRPRKKETHKSS